MCRIVSLSALGRTRLEYRSKRSRRDDIGTEKVRKRGWPRAEGSRKVTKNKNKKILVPKQRYDIKTHPEQRGSGSGDTDILLTGLNFFP